MRSLSKLLVTRWRGGILTARMADGRAVQLDMEPEESSCMLGSIYIGKVKNIVKNIGAAFVDLGNGRMGYYSIQDNKTHLFAGGPGGRKLSAGDEIIVQISRDAVKTKAPVLTSALNFPGRYCVLTLGNTAVGVSAKIKDGEKRQALRRIAEEHTDGSFGLVIRTNAEKASEKDLTEEIGHLKKRLLDVLDRGGKRTCYSCLYRAIPSYIQGIRDAYAGDLEAIITDVPGIFEELFSYLSEFQPEDTGKLTLYEDPLLPLEKLYSLERAVGQALSKKAWLKSGGYLVIEPTEALVVVDVNSGKYDGRKCPDDAILKINLEAADELSRQLRLRNLSGIIIADFIDMAREGDRETLMARLRQTAAADPVKTAVVEMTKLGLVEMTRKKVRRPFYEQYRQIAGGCAED